MTTKPFPSDPQGGAGGRGGRPAIGILSVHPAPYRDPTHVGLFERDPGVRVLHFQSIDTGHSEWKLQRDPRDRSEFVDPRAGGRLATCVGVLRWLRAGSFDAVVVPGYATAPALTAIGYCVATETPFVVAIDTVEGGIAHGVVGALKRSVLSRASGLWVPGKASRRHFERAGWPATAIAEGYYCLDVERIARTVELRRTARAELRGTYRIPDGSRVFLSVGKLIPARRMDVLAETFCSLDLPDDAHLVVVGDGPQEPRLHELAERFPRRLTHVPRLPFDALPDLYALADVYVHAGSEPYSTACEYAAAAGLALVTSRRVGYHADLLALTAGRGHATFDTDAELARALVEHAHRPIDARSEADASAVLQRSPEWAGRQLLALVHDVVLRRTSGRRARAGANA